MEKQALDLLETLSTKLGTTVDQMWAILLKQAPISATIDFIQYAMIGVAVWFFVKMVKKYWDDEMGDAKLFVVCATGMILGALSIVAFSSFPNSVTALLNPDYWALKQILSAVKAK